MVGGLVSWVWRNPATRGQMFKHESGGGRVNYVTMKYWDPAIKKSSEQLVASALSFDVRDNAIKAKEEVVLPDDVTVYRMLYAMPRTHFSGATSSKSSHVPSREIGRIRPFLYGPSDSCGIASN